MPFQESTRVCVCGAEWEIKECPTAVATPDIAAAAARSPAFASTAVAPPTTRLPGRRCGAAAAVALESPAAAAAPAGAAASARSPAFFSAAVVALAASSLHLRG